MKKSKKRAVKRKVTKFAMVLITTGKTIQEVSDNADVSRPKLHDMKSGKNTDSIKDETWSKVAAFLKKRVKEIKGYI
jgi:hypothetical protein